jgi:hypothetical protein
MSTNAGIALRSGDTYQTIYCHWDGYPKYMLPMLQNNYNSVELAAKLISYGDASFIDAKLESTGEHSFMKPEEGVSVFYHRDRGDAWIECQPVCYTEKELFDQSGFEYVYIFEDGQWNAYKRNGERIYI